VANYRLINDGAISIYIHPWFDSKRGENQRHNIDIAVAVCVIENDKPYVFSVSDQVQHFMDWKTEYYEPTRWSTTYGQSNGVYVSKTHGSYTWPDTMFEQVASLFGSATCWWKGSSRYYYYPSPENLFEAAMDVIEQECRKLIRSGFDGHFKGWSRSSFSSRSIRFLVDEDVNKYFLLHENNIIAEGYPAQFVDPKGLTNYWLNVLTQEAYLDALNHVPRLNDNSISNIIELVGFIKSIVVDHELQIPKSLGEAWLSYRYQYQTTKLDTEEAISFVRRSLQLGTLNRTLSCYGVSSREITRNDLSANVTCRCCCDVTPKDVKTLEKIWRALYTYGLQPGFYVVWDSIPYSFIVDWFIPIGNLASTLDAERMYSGTYYDITNICYSLTYDIKDEFGSTHHQYSRWVSDGQPVLNGFYSLETDKTSQKVIGMRALDVLSLFIGKG
jgi:hypothetical protein